MAFYGQKIYNQQLGNGKLTIAEAGCFLTAFCNLRIKQGLSPVDPPTLDLWFRQNGDFYKDNDGAMEDLAWDSISKYDPNFVVDGAGNSPLPPSPDAIVKFVYRSVHTGQMITHFCLVDRIENGQLYIVDSWDGLVKSPSAYQKVYGQPVAWATYLYRTPAPAPTEASATPVNTAPKPPAGPVPIPTSTTSTYRVLQTLKGYRTSGQAATRTNPLVQVPSKTYYIFNQFNGMINVTNTPGTPGAWINPNDNVEPAPPVKTYQVVVTVRGFNTSNDAANHLSPSSYVEPATYTVFNEAHGMINVTTKPGSPGAWINPADNVASQNTGVDTSWRKSYVSNPQVYIAKRPVASKDLNGQQGTLSLQLYDNLKGVGNITGPNGKPYVLSKVGSGLYAVPRDALELESEIYSTATNIETRLATNNKKVTDSFLLVLAQLANWWDKYVKTLKEKV